MRIYYFENGEIWNSVLRQDELISLPDVNTQSIEVDEEMEENKLLIILMSSQSTWKNADGLGRWYVLNGVLYERTGWIPFPPPTGVT